MIVQCLNIGGYCKNCIYKEECELYKEKEKLKK